MQRPGAEHPDTAVELITETVLPSNINPASWIAGTTPRLFNNWFVPMTNPGLAAYAATYAEHLFPVLIIIGLGTRVSAIALLVMTLVIQLFVVPTGWPTHLLWLAPLVYLIGRGPGPFSLDRLLKID